MLWMQSVWSGVSVISSVLKTHQERSVELNFKFQTGLVSNISKGVYKMIEIIIIIIIIIIIVIINITVL